LEGRRVVLVLVLILKNWRGRGEGTPVVELGHLSEGWARDGSGVDRRGGRGVTLGFAARDGGGCLVWLDWVDGRSGFFPGGINGGTATGVDVGELALI
jgi:hypothetical protein